MANYSRPYKEVWVCVENNRGGRDVMSSLTLSEEDVHRTQYNTKHLKLFSNSFVALDSASVKFNSQNTGETLNKYEQQYKRDNNLATYKQQRKGAMDQTSMLNYTQKVHELVSKRNLVLTPPEKQHQVQVNNFSQTNSIGPGRWTTLQKMRRPAHGMNLHSVSDSHWNYNAERQRRSTTQNQTLQRPRSELNFTVKNPESHKASQVGDSSRPYSESDSSETRPLVGKWTGYLQNNSNDLINGINDDANTLSLPNITESMDSLNFEPRQSIQIVPFPAIELQAVPAVLHSSKQGVNKNCTVKQNRTKNAKVKTPQKPVGKMSGIKGKLFYNSGEKRFKSTTETKKTDYHQEGNLDIHTNTCKLTNGDTKMKAKYLHGTPGATSKQSQLRHLEQNEYEIPVCFESSESPQNIKSVLKKDTVRQKDKVSQNKQKKKSVQFGEQMVREVTKIVYPWNRAFHSDDSPVLIHGDDSSSEDDEELDLRDIVYDDSDDSLDT